MGESKEMFQIGSERRQPWSRRLEERRKIRLEVAEERRKEERRKVDQRDSSRDKRKIREGR
jgi:hypothetical protein